MDDVETIVADFESFERCMHAGDVRIIIASWRDALNRLDIGRTRQWTRASWRWTRRRGSSALTSCWNAAARSFACTTTILTTRMLAMQ